MTTSTPTTPATLMKDGGEHRCTGSHAAFGAYSLGAVGVALYGLFVYCVLTPAGAVKLGGTVAPSMQEMFANNKGAIYSHVVASSLALVLTVPQLWPSLRRSRLELHRWLGRAYVLCVGVGSTSGFVVGLKASGGTVARIGFCTLASLWFTVTLGALVAVLAGRIGLHKRIMVYSSALSYSAVTIRLYLGIGLAATGGDFDAVYPVVTWLCFVPNIPAAELILRFLQRRDSQQTPATDTSGELVESQISPMAVAA